MRFSTGKMIMLGVLGAAMVLFPAEGLRALGLGEARVDSYLGQPLDITIRLIEADSAALDSLTVAPATARDYERLGVPSAALALGLEVSIDRRVHPPLLRVQSRRAVNDPVVQFMIDARWSSGRVLREYTLFLDPPTLDVAPPVARAEPERPVAVEPATRAEPEPRAEPRPRAPAAAPAEPAPRAEARPEPAPRPISGPEVIGPIGAGQTLWSVAYNWRPDTSLTMNQVMLAIFERNPQAFMGGNVNRLRRGAELTMPSAEDVRALSAAEADRRIRDQMQAWRQDTGQRQVPVVTEAAVPEVETETPAPAPEPSVPEQPDVVHRLEVVPPESDVFDEGPAVSEGEVRRASGRLSELEEQMYADELERDDLLRQIDSIREAIDTREAAGLAVADEEMALFEERLREARLARAEREAALAETEDDEVGSYFRQLEDELGLASDGPAEAVDEGAGMAVAESEDEPVSETAPAPMPMAATPAGRGLPSWLWPAVAAVLVIGLLIGLLVMRRRSAATESSAGRSHDVSAERARVAASPSNLAAHLALLEALAANDDADGFSNALDDMYRQVEHDEDPHWQDALNLAVMHAPNHPLLTPHETPMADDLDDDEGLDDRTREMLGILGADDTQASTANAEQGSPDDYELGSDLQADDELDEEFFGDETDDELDAPASHAETPLAGDADEEITGDDFDLAEISDRLDRDTERADNEVEAVEAEDDSFDLEETLDLDDEAEPGLTTFSLDDEKASETQTDQASDASDEAPSEDEGLSLDFSFSDARPAEAEADRVEPADAAGEESDAGLTDDGDALEQTPDGDAAETVPAEPEADPDSEIEAFLHPDQGAESEVDTADDEADQADADEGEPELSDEDAEVKLDLARAYLSMDDPDSARTLLEEITSGGSSTMRKHARKLLDDI
jgi:pilus assembly protein FimV